MAAYTPTNGREIVSEVLLKLQPEALPKLPMACKTCPSAMWQITGNPDRPDAVTVRCYCPMMHTFTWDSRNQEEILDCDHLYEEEDEDEEGPSRSRRPKAEQDDADDLPPYLKAQREKQLREQAEAELGERHVLEEHEGHDPHGLQ